MEKLLLGMNQGMRAVLRLAVFAVLLSACASLAQETASAAGEDEQPAAPAQQTPAQTPEITPTPAGLMPPGSPPVSEFHSKFFYGGELTQGETAPSDRTLRYSGAFIDLRPHFEFLWATKKSQIALAANPVLAYYATEGTLTAINGIMDPSLNVSVAVSPRLTWFSRTTFTYGEEASRLNSANPPNCGTECGPAAIGGTALEGGGTQSNVPLLSNPQDLAVRDFSHNYLILSGGTGFTYESGRRQFISMAVGDAYSFSDSFNVAYARAQISELVTHTTAISSYGQVNQYQYADSHCTLYGVGVGVAHELAHTSSIQATIGPEYGSRDCPRRLGMYFDGVFVKRLSERYTISAAANRDLNATYLAGNLWVDTFQSGVDGRIARNVFTGLYAGYFRSDRGFSATHSWQGFTVSPQVRWRLQPNLDLIGTYRYYDIGTDMTSTLRRGVILFTLSWRPRPFTFQ